LSDDLTLLPQQLPQDIIYNILLQSNIYQLNNLCYIDKYNYKICSSSAFWDIIFNRDGYELFADHDNAADWIAEYFKMKELYTLVKGVIVNINKFKNVNISVDDSLRWIKQFVSSLKHQNKRINIQYIDHGQYDISTTLHTITVNKNELKLILLKTFYYYNRVFIENMRGDNMIPVYQYKSSTGEIVKRVKSRHNVKKIKKL